VLAAGALFPQEKVGDAVGDGVVGDFVGAFVGDCVGDFVGDFVGASVGAFVGGQSHFMLPQVGSSKVFVPSPLLQKVTPFCVTLFPQLSAAG